MSPRDSCASPTARRPTGAPARKWRWPSCCSSPARPRCAGAIRRRGGWRWPTTRAPGLRTEMTSLLEDLRAIVGERHVLAGGGEDLLGYERDWRKRYRGLALCVVLPGSADEVAAVVRRCAREDGASIVPQ